jgi:hypothetical protein
MKEGISQNKENMISNRHGISRNLATYHFSHPGFISLMSLIPDLGPVLSDPSDTYTGLLLSVYRGLGHQQVLTNTG